MQADRRWELFLKTALAVAGLAALCVEVRADEFTEGCERLAAQARIQVQFEDREPTRDDSLDAAALKVRAQHTANPRTRVLGLTHSELTTRLKIQTGLLSSPAGQVCTAPSIDLTLAFADFRVFVARDLTEPCRRAVIEAHELEHVNIWRSHLRAGAQLLATQLRNELAQPQYHPDLATARIAAGPHVRAAIGRPLASLVEGIRAANREIDSPASYKLEALRMAACPPEPRGGAEPTAER